MTPRPRRQPATTAAGIAKYASSQPKAEAVPMQKSEIAAKRAVS